MNILIGIFIETLELYSNNAIFNGTVSVGKDRQEYYFKKT